MLNFQKFPISVEEQLRSNSGLRSALNRLASGSPPTPRSWVYEHESPSWILSAVESMLHDMQDLEVISDWDLSKSDKFGPQGGASPLVDRLDTLEEYWSHLGAPTLLTGKDRRVWEQAKAATIRDFGFNESGTPSTSQSIISRGLSEDKYNTSSGWPLYIKRNRVEAREQALSSQSDVLTGFHPTTLGSRATMGKTGKSARNIFMASMAVNVFGQRYQQPLQDYIRNRGIRFFIPWNGWDQVQEEINRLWTPEVLKFGADYTKMDQHFNIHHGLECYDVIKHFFRKEYWAELEDDIRLVFNVPVLTNLGVIYDEHSMPSGSEWTNFLETVWNYIFIHYLELKHHLHFTGSMGIGDDQLWFLSVPSSYDEQNIQSLVSLVTEEFANAGLPGNPEKQEVSFTKTSFLQRLLTAGWTGNWNHGGVAGVYPLVRNITSQVFPERYHNSKSWNKDMFVLRVIMIAENCREHPKFKSYCEFLYKSNSNIPEFMEYSNGKLREIERQSRSIGGFIPTYTNVAIPRRGIQAFKTYETFKTFL